MNFGPLEDDFWSFLGFFLDILELLGAFLAILGSPGALLGYLERA